jgi:hypothetical protein
MYQVQKSFFWAKTHFLCKKKLLFTSEFSFHSFWWQVLPVHMINGSTFITPILIVCQEIARWWPVSNVCHAQESSKQKAVHLSCHLRLGWTFWSLGFRRKGRKVLPQNYFASRWKNPVKHCKKSERSRTDMDAFCCQFRLSALLRYWLNDVHQSWRMDLRRSDRLRLIWHKRGGFEACATQEGHSPYHG